MSFKDECERAFLECALARTTAKGLKTEFDL